MRLIRTRPKFKELVERYGFSDFNPSIAERKRLDWDIRASKEHREATRFFLLKAFNIDIDRRIVADSNDAEIAKEALSTLRKIAKGDKTLSSFITPANVLKIIRMKRQKFKTAPYLFKQKIEEV